MKTILIAYLSSIISLAMLDFAWLSIMFERIYKPSMANILAEKMSFAPAIVFYLLYAGGVVGLVILPALKHEWNLGHVLMMACLLGAVAYGTYDLTNQATLKDWSTTMTIIDIAWGATLTTIVSGVAWWISRTFQ